MRLGLNRVWLMRYGIEEDWQKKLRRYFMDIHRPLGGGRGGQRRVLLDFPADAADEFPLVHRPRADLHRDFRRGRAGGLRQNEGIPVPAGNDRPQAEKETSGWGVIYAAADFHHSTRLQHVRQAARCIASLTAQTYPNLEFLFVDDGSTDNSVQVIQQYADSRFRILRKKNGGVSSARNEGLRNMRGE